MTARVLVCVLAVAVAGEAMPNIHADYPDPEDYNLVTLSCTNSSRLDLLIDANFLRRAPEQDSLVQLPGSPINGEINITLTQEKEGYFSCSSANGGGPSTNEIGLAGTAARACAAKT